MSLNPAPAGFFMPVEIFKKTVVLHGPVCDSGCAAILPRSFGEQLCKIQLKTQIKP